MELYNSRTQELSEAIGPFSREDAVKIFHKSLSRQTIDNMLELNYYESLRVHNLKYYTWIEQQQKNLEDLNAQWYNRNYWTEVQSLTPKIDALLEEFNNEVGLLDKVK